ncbi:hypothetical protein ACC691_37990, partial [Rhizobium johnstonii]|uniref:hypothetical protein n=1 Tax=Rhizobium johnstonii TaxID=3019933 RepID=UPI003F96ECEC
DRRDEVTDAVVRREAARKFAPPVMVFGVALGVFLGLFGVAQAALGQTPWLLLGFLAPAVYLLFVIIATILATGRDGIRVSLWCLLVLPCIHFCWGLGFLL